MNKLVTAAVASLAALATVAITPTGLLAQGTERVLRPTRPAHYIRRTELRMLKKNNTPQLPTLREGLCHSLK